MLLHWTTWMPGAVPCASIDWEVAQWFRQNLTPHFVDVLWVLTTPGSALVISAVVGVCVAALAWKRRWFAMATLVGTVGGGSLIGEALNRIIERPRPFAAGPWGPWGGYSFPSGHTIAATLLYGFLALALVRGLERRRWRHVSAGVGMVLILGVGFSRIALGAHYLSDVLGAMTLGGVWIFLCPLVLRRVGSAAMRKAPTAGETDGAETGTAEGGLEPVLAE